ncbi:MAG: FAD-dependent monooxygenase [Euryarchaeota archaeon]|nr:FAD-dependent monooxygenase [Euryarchaeota archaeon]
MSTEVAIIGGGICGLTTAIALENRGFEPTVYESTETYRPVGAGILLQTNALSVLDSIGLAARIEASGIEIDAVPFLSPDGSRLFGFDLAFERDRFGHGFVAIHRAKLQELLLDELETTVRTGMECVSVTEPETPTVAFSDGSTVSPDCVIGADGIGSAVRAEICPTAEPRPADCIAYRGLAPAADLPGGTDPGFEVWGEGSFVGCSPLGDGRVYWYATATGPVAPDGTAVDRKSALRQRFDAYPEPVPQLLASTAADGIIVTPLADLAPLGRWSTGAVTLAGDAAHAMLPFVGQGAAQGIEDAAVLAAVLDAHETPAAAFKQYEQCRKSRAEGFVATSRRLGRLAAVDSAVGWRLRNLGIRLLPGKLSRRLRRQQAMPSRYQPASDR